MRPKRSIETNISKNSSFLVNKSFWLNFPGIFEHDKPHGTFRKGPQGILTITVEVIRSFPLQLRGCWKRKFLKKRQSFQWKKLLTDFSRIIEYDQPQGTIYNGPQGILTKTREVIGSFP